MKQLGFNYFAILVLFTSGESKGQVSSPFPDYFATTTPLPEQVMKTTNDFGLVEQKVNIYPESTAATKAQSTYEPETRPELTSNILSLMPQRPETSQFPDLPQSANSDASEVNMETNSINDVFTEDDEYFSINPGTTSPEENSVQEVQTTKPTLPVESQVTTFDVTNSDPILEQIESSNINKDFTSRNGKTGLEPWKIGLITAAAFLAIEVVVLMIYCFACRKRRRAIITNTCEQDSEAGETINVESNDNTVIREEGNINCSTLPHAVDYQHLVVKQGEEQRKNEINDTIISNRSTNV